MKAIQITEEGNPTVLSINAGGAAGVLTESLNLALTDKVGHYAYFRGVRDYLVELQERVFVDEVFVPGGFADKADFKLCAWRLEKSKMTMVDAEAENLGDIVEVQYEHSTAAVLMNGTFFREGEFGNPFGDGTHGAVVGADSQLLGCSGTCGYESCPNRAWFGQEFGSGSYVDGVGSDAPYGPLLYLSAGVSGLLKWVPGNPSSVFPMYDTENKSQKRSAMLHLGIANEKAVGQVLFILYTNEETMWPPITDPDAGWRYPSDVIRLGNSGLFKKLTDSGVMLLLGLDGGGSIGVAHEDQAGTVAVRARGLRHLASPFQKVNNYIVFEIAD